MDKAFRWFDRSIDRSEPQESVTGIVLVIASAVVMTFLFWAKSRTAKKLGSSALRAEAMESLMCDLQDLTVLFGLGLNALLGWWWADPVAALALIPFMLKEGWEGSRPIPIGYTASVSLFQLFFHSHVFFFLLTLYTK